MTDVVVVGGGLAGLTAARELGWTGVDVVLLEGRDRLGGRTWTGTFEGIEVELGGAFVHWLQPFVWTEIRRYGLALSRVPDHDVASWIVNGALVEGSARRLQELSGAALEAFAIEALEVFPEPFDPLQSPAVRSLEDVTLQDRLSTIEDAEERAVMGAIMIGLASAPPDEVGFAHAVLRMIALAGWRPELLWETNARFGFIDGTRALVDAIMGDCARTDVHLSSRVTGIEHDAEGVRVLTADGTVQARACVVAAPVNTVRDIAFTPDVSPGRRALLDEGILGRGVKVWARLRGELPHFSALSPGSEGLNFVESIRYHDGDTIAIGFGPSAAALDIHDPGAVQRAFDGPVPGAEVAACGGHDWTHDPLAQTTWTMYRPGQLSRLEDLRRREGRVVFAGADIAQGWAGYMDGAIETGISAARETLALLR